MVPRLNGGGMDWLRSHQLLRYLTIRLTREGGIVANRTAMDPLQVLDNDTFSPIHVLPIPSFYPRGQSPLGQSPGGGSDPQEEPWVQAINVLQLRHEAGELF